MKQNERIIQEKTQEICNQTNEALKNIAFTENEVLSIATIVMLNLYDYDDYDYKGQLLSQLSYLMQSNQSLLIDTNSRLLKNKIKNTSEYVVFLIIKAIENVSDSTEPIGINVHKLTEALYHIDAELYQKQLIQYISTSISKIEQFIRNISGTTWNVLETLDYMLLEQWVKIIEVYYEHSLREEPVEYFNKQYLIEPTAQEEILSEFYPIIKKIVQNIIVKQRVISLFNDEFNELNRKKYYSIKAIEQSLKNTSEVRITHYWLENYLEIIITDTLVEKECLNITCIFDKKIALVDNMERNITYMKECKIV